MSNITDILDKLAGTTGLDDGARTSIDGLFDVHVNIAGFAFEADDNTQRQLLFVNNTGGDLYLQSAQYTPEAAVTADNTNYSVVDLVVGAAPASASDVAATMQTTIAAGTGNWVANTPEALTPAATVALRTIANGESIVALLDGTNGTGVDLPIGTWTLHLKRA